MLQLRVVNRKAASSGGIQLVAQLKSKKCALKKSLKLLKSSFLLLGMSTQTIVIVNPGTQNSVGASLQVNGITFTAPITSLGISSSSGLVLSIANSSAPVWQTGDAMPFTTSAGQNLAAINGNTYCVQNTASVPINFAIFSSPSELVSNAFLIQPKQFASFKLNTAATGTSQMTIYSGCSTASGSQKNLLITFAIILGALILISAVAMGIYKLSKF